MPSSDSVSVQNQLERCNQVTGATFVRNFALVSTQSIQCKLVPPLDVKRYCTIRNLLITVLIVGRTSVSLSGVSTNLLFVRLQVSYFMQSST